MKNCLRSIYTVFFCLCTVSLVCAGGKKDAAPQEAVDGETAVTVSKNDTPVLTVATLNGPTSIPVAYLYENTPKIDGYNVAFELMGNAQQELPKLIKGEVQIGVLPANAAAKVYTANNGALITLGVCGNGNLFLLTKNAAVQSLADLKGKTVTCAGQGATPEYVFTYLLKHAGVAVGEGEQAVTLDFSIANADIPAALISDKIRYALVPEPFATIAEIKGQGILRAIDIQQAYASAQDGDDYPLTLLVANAQFAAEHKAVVDAYIEAYKKAAAWTMKNPTRAGVLVQKHTLGLMAPVVARSIPHAAYVWVDAQTARASIEKLLQLYLSFAPEAIGGQLPADGFYYAP